MNIKEKCIFLEERITRLNEIGIALSTEKDTNKLFELILEEAKNITNADGRTLYMVDNEGNLKFEIMRNDSMNTVMGGTSGVDIPFPAVPKYFDDGEPNLSNVSAYAAITGDTINIEDAYEEKGYDFSGAKSYDKSSGYRSKSFLTMPLKNHENEIIGVMQLINATDKNTGEVVSFSTEVQEQVESIASQGAVALTNKRLVEELKNLFESFIKLIATAIDKKSPYTGGHCERVPLITTMLADAVEKVDYGKYKDFSMTEDERYELHIAGWLHDCGKVATPPHVVDKGTKLETITDRIDTIKTRFEILRRDAEIDFLKKKIELNGTANGEIKNLEKEYADKLEQLNDDEAFIEKCNVGGEFMEKELQNRVLDIANYDYKQQGEKTSFLSENEVRNLNIPKGTLLPEEREIINDHIVITIDMLEKLPYPKHLKNVPEFAGGHHEKLDGTGYPKGLKADQMSVQAKMMAIADIYEALTAADRPYKDGKKLSMAMRIMGFMKNDYHIDKDLFEIFVNEGVYKKYAKDYLNKSQIDEVDKKTLLS
ncbi:MAG: HD domain-containing phosphohydrolase [Candidatus Marinimicrobia bacterium]|jgi:HD-GYP domain-containing protein (c-di-GMP phosphodiesterase class II)|nr:HD domain-containing phosphohydrolase [Candidatus Neomarinimicrobiota bacterium]